ncbi:MAG: ankyrin repeat domain-containing protein [bacterium]|nr:ankyrin repeat domain-containing protein [bacterium]
MCAAKVQVNKKGKSASKKKPPASPVGSGTVDIKDLFVRMADALEDSKRREKASRPAVKKSLSKAGKRGRRPESEDLGELDADMFQRSGNDGDEIGNIDFFGGSEPDVHIPVLSKPSLSNAPPAPFLSKQWNKTNAVERERFRKKLFKAAVSGSIEEVCNMLDNGIPPDIEDDVGTPFFMRVAERGRTALLKETISYVKSVDMRDSNKNTILMACAECGHTESVRMLLNLKGKNRPNLNARNRNNQTAMMLAAWEGNLDEVELLCEAGANHKLTDKYKNTAADYAKLEGHGKVEKYLRSLK